MKFRDIQKPAFMQEAAQSRSHGIFFYVLITLMLYLVGSLLGGILQIPGMMVYFFQSPEYLRMLQTGTPDINTMMKLMENIPEWYTILLVLSSGLLIPVFLVYCRWVDGRKLRTMGFVRKKMLRQYLLGLVLGGGMFCIAVGICILSGSVSFTGLAGNVIPLYIIFYFLAYLFQGMAEEVLCRGFLFVCLTKRHSVVLSAVISAIFFSALHGMNAGVSSLAFLNLFLFGMFMALLFVACENIWIVGAVHTAWNFVQGNIFGIQVSGLSKQNSVFGAELREGWSSINGGSFGLEGGLAVTGVLLASLAILIVYFRKTGKLAEPERIGEGESFNRQLENCSSAASEVKAAVPPVPQSAPLGEQPEKQGRKSTEPPAAGSAKEKTIFDENYFKD